MKPFVALQRLLTSIKNKEDKPERLELVYGKTYIHEFVCQGRSTREPIYYRSSYKERRANALAPGAEEGRDKLRKAVVRSKYP